MASMIKCPIITPKGYSINYGIDEYGNLYSMRDWIPKKLAKHVNDNGYCIMTIRICGKSYYFKAHRLVMINFHGYDCPNMDVNHIDGNKQNNHISNLEWCTRSENLKHAYRNNLHKPAPSYGNANGNSQYPQELIEKVIIDIFINKNTCTNCSKKYKVGINTCKSIKDKRSWVWLTNKILNDYVQRLSK